MFFSLFRQRERTKRDHVARFESEGISTLRTELRDSLRSNRSSLHLKVPFSVVAFLCCLSRYCNFLTITGCFATLPCFRVAPIKGLKTYSSLLHYCKLDPSKGRLDCFNDNENYSISQSSIFSVSVENLIPTLVTLR